ncbi:MFS transporter [Candidatus Woesearchaeota archaeon]|nr:MFS transporter [Candidatus Woesearchaeota archaeon]
MNYDKKSKALFYGLEFVNGFRRNITSLLLIVYFVFLGHDPVKVTTLIFFSSIVFALFEIPSGAFADHYSRKLSLLISFFLMSLSFLGFYLFKEFWLLAICFVLNDIAFTFQSGTNSAWIIDELKIGKKKKEITSLFTKSMFSEKSGQFIAGIIGFFIIALQFKIIWLIISLTNLVIFFLILFYAEERNFKSIKNEKHFIVNTFIQAKNSFAHLFHKTNKNLRGLVISDFIGNISLNSFYITMPLILYQILKFPPENISLLSILMAGVALFGPFIGGHIAHKKGFKKSLSSLFLGLFVAMAIFALSKNLILSLIVLSLFKGLEAALGTVFDSAQHHEIPSHLRATLSSIINQSWSIANALSALLVSVGLIYFDLIITTMIVSSISLITAISYGVMLKE